MRIGDGTYNNIKSRSPEVDDSRTRSSEVDHNQLYCTVMDTKRLLQSHFLAKLIHVVEKSDFFTPTNPRGRALHYRRGSPKVEPRRSNFLLGLIPYR